MVPVLARIRGMVALNDNMEFRLVFEGEFVAGFKHEQVRHAFMQRFGEGPAVAVFSKARAVRGFA